MECDKRDISIKCRQVSSHILLDVNTTNTDNQRLQVSPKAHNLVCDSNHGLHVSINATDCKYDPKLSAVEDSSSREQSYKHQPTDKAFGTNVASNVRNNSTQMAMRSVFKLICLSSTTNALV
ncbi:hypothetical protein Tco_0137099 [Tanacetum coccineum]